MYKLIVIDDEETIRSGLKFFVENSRSDFEVAGVFSNGNEALEFLNENTVELVITDIKMDEVSGVDVMRFIHESKLSTKIVVISGYKNFDYSASAIEYGARFYITKPTRFEELMRVFDVVSSEITAEQEEKEQNKLMQEQLHYLKEEFFRNIFDKNVSKDEFFEKLSVIGEGGEFEKYKFVIIGMGISAYEDYCLKNLNIGTDKNTEGIVNNVKRFFAEYLLNVICVHKKHGRFKFIVYSSEYTTAAELADFVDTKTTELDKFITNATKTQANFYISSVYNDIKDFFFNKSISLDSMVNDEVESDKHKLAQIEKYIIENITNDITLQQVADHFNYNMNYFSGYFKQQMGQNFSQYLITMKMNFAKDMLRNTDKKLSQISDALGYCELTYFFKVFKKAVGTSPMEYRRRHENS